MAVENGGPVEASYTNSKLVSRTTDSSTIGRVGLLNGLPESGPAVTNVQRAINKGFEVAGISNETDALANDYASNERVADGDNRKVAIEKLDQAFNSTTGHNHSGAGQGGQISAASLSQLNYFRAEWQFQTITAASGLTFDVSSSFTAEVPGGGASTEGVITSAPSNRVVVLDSNGTPIEDAEGQRVFARLTEAAGVWTLSFFTLEIGAEVAHNLSAQDIGIFYLKVFSLANVPTIPSDPFFNGTVDVTADVVDASNTQRGLVSTGPQSFAGEKTFVGDIKALSNLLVEKIDAVTVTANEISDLQGTVIEITDGTATDLDAITGALGPNKILLLVNKTGNTLNINSNVGIDGFLINGGNSIPLDDKCGILLRRDDFESRWQVIGGGGGGGSSFANLQLSNLIGPTNINAGLIPNTDNILDLGSPTARWGYAFLGSARLIDSIQFRKATLDILVDAREDALPGVNFVRMDKANGFRIVGPESAFIDAQPFQKDIMLQTATNSSDTIAGNIMLFCGQNGPNSFGLLDIYARSLVLPRRTTDPSGTVPSTPGQAWLYYNTTTNKIRWHNGTQWQDLGSGGFDLQNITTNTTLGQTANYFLVDATSGNITLTINPATRWRYSIKRTDSTANIVSIVPSSGLIDGATVYFISNQYEATEVYADGSNLWVF